MCCVQETLSTSTPEGQEHALPGARPGGPLFAYLISLNAVAINHFSHNVSRLTCRHASDFCGPT